MGLMNLSFDFLTLKLVRFIGVGNLPTNFGVSGTFRSRLMGQQLSEEPRNLATLTFDLQVTALVCNMGLRSPYVFQVSSS